MGRRSKQKPPVAKETVDPKVIEDVEKRIEVPNEVLALNLGKVTKKDEIPELTTLWDEEYAFQLVSLNVSFVTRRGENRERGINKVRIDGKFNEPRVNVMDVLPKTEWVPKDYSAEASFGLDPLGIIGKIVTPPGGVTAGLTFRYNWNPKAARMISGGASGGVHWYSESAEKQYLDGNYQVSIMFLHPKDIVGPFDLGLDLFVHHDIGQRPDEYINIHKDVSVKVKV